MVSLAIWSNKHLEITIYFLLATCNVCPVAIPEIFAQTQGSDYWQFTHCVRGFDL